MLKYIDSSLSPSTKADTIPGMMWNRCWPLLAFHSSQLQPLVDGAETTCHFLSKVGIWGWLVVRKSGSTHYSTTPLYQYPATMLIYLLIALVVGELLLCRVTGSPIGPHRAPLYGATHPNKVPNSYVVMLYFTLPNSEQKSFRLPMFTSQRNTSYTLDQHWQTIGIDLSSSEGFDDLSALSGYTSSQIVGNQSMVRCLC